MVEASWDVLQMRVGASAGTRGRVRWSSEASDVLAQSLDPLKIMRRERVAEQSAQRSALELYLLAIVQKNHESVMLNACQQRQLKQA